MRIEAATQSALEGAPDLPGAEAPPGRLDRLMAAPDVLDRFRGPHAFHLVGAGETLAGIASARGTDAGTLIRINGLAGPEVQPGQQLRLPEAPTAVEAPSEPPPPPVTADQIRAIMPAAGDRADLYVDALNAAMEANGITTPEQRAAFLAQIAVESGDLRHTEENLNYSARRLTEVWPRRFPTLAAAAPYANNPEALANRVYADRLGNGDEASGDGWRFRGRGLMQVTGRANYEALGHAGRPEALAEPATAAATAAQWWANAGLPARTAETLDRTAFNGISRTVNGGDHGSEARWQAYQRALTALAPAPAQP